MEKQTPEEFYKDTYGEDPPKKFDTSSSAYIFSFAAAYANHVNKQPNKEVKEQAKDICQKTKKPCHLDCVAWCRI